MNPNPKLRTPLLSQLILDGKIFVDQDTGEYVGVAADGREVAIGAISDRDAAEKYLSTHPLPENW